MKINGIYVIFTDWDSFQYWDTDLVLIQSFYKDILTVNCLIHILLIGTQFSTYVLNWFQSSHFLKISINI